MAFPPHEYADDKNEINIPGQNRYADFKFAVCFLVGGLLMLDNDENATF